MIGNQQVLGLILARGGSKRLPGKNIVGLGGKPLIAWTIDAAKASTLIDRLVVSSDDQGIITVAKTQGADAPFTRPSHLATDEASSEEATLHALDSLGLEDGYLVLLQPTSPFRTADDIDACVRLCHNAKAEGVVAVCPPDKPGHWLLQVDDKGRVQPVMAEAFDGRVAAPQLAFPNGAVFVVRIEHFRANKTFWPENLLAYEMPKNRSVDIDSPDDLAKAEQFINDNSLG